ncbi:DNA-binding winged helix-turn-helix (wHTH) protein [Nitrobacteraceae bacterium AZCC 2146]
MGDSDNLRTNDVALFGPFRLFAAERLLEKAGEPLHLGGRALDILITLVERAGQVVTRKELISRVWPDVIVEEANLRVHVAGLRKALGDGRDGACYVANIPGRGYCFVAPVTRSSSRRSLSPAQPVITDRVRKLPARLTRMVDRDDIYLSGTTENTPLEVWESTFNVNVKDVFLGSKAAIPALRKSGGGSIINILLELGSRRLPRRCGLCSFEGRRSAVDQATASEVAKDNIRVNSVHSSLTATNMTKDFIANDAEQTEKLIGPSLLGRPARAEEIANVALFLASDEASFMTGSEVVVDGGLHRRPARQRLSERHTRDG